MTKNLPFKTDWALLVFFTALLVTPTLLSFYLPMSDLAFHEAIVGLLQHLGDPQFAPSSLYRINPGHPNQLFHVTCFLLAKSLGTRVAVKVVIASTQAALILGAGRIATSVGKSPLLGLLATPMALGWFLYWGLITNMVGLAVLWLSWPTMVSTARLPTTANLAKITVIFIVLFFAHETAFAMGVVLFALLSTISSRSWTSLFRALVPCLIAGVLAIAHLRYQEALFAKSVFREPPDFPTLGHRAARLTDSLFGTHALEIWAAQGFVAIATLVLLARHHWGTAGKRQRVTTLLLGGLLLLVLVVSYGATRVTSTDETSDLAIVRWLSALAGIGVIAFSLHRFGAFNALLSAARDPAERERLRTSFEGHPSLLAGGFLFVLFWIAPFNWNGATFLYERFLSPAFLLLGIGLAPSGKLARAVGMSLSILPLSTLAVALPQFGEAHRVGKELQPLLGHIPIGSATVLVQFEPGATRGRSFSPQTMAARVLAERGGRTSIQFTDSPISIVTMTPEFRWERTTRRFLKKSSNLRLPVDFKSFSFAIIHSSSPTDQFFLRLALEPFAQFVDRSGEWMLFQSRVATIPIDAPEVPAGAIPSRTLPALCQDVADRHLGLRDTSRAAESPSPAEPSPQKPMAQPSSEYFLPNPTPNSEP